jgi:hypothetical protein
MQHGRHDDRLCVAAVFDTFSFSFLVGKECCGVACYFTRVVCRVVGKSTINRYKSPKCQQAQFRLSLFAMSMALTQLRLRSGV